MHYIKYIFWYRRNKEFYILWVIEKLYLKYSNQTMQDRIFYLNDFWNITFRNVFRWKYRTKISWTKSCVYLFDQLLWKQTSYIRYRHVLETQTSRETMGNTKYKQNHYIHIWAFCYPCFYKYLYYLPFLREMY